MIKRVYYLVTLLLLLTTAIFAEDLKISPKLEMGILPNGLTYYIYKNKKPEGKASVSLVVGSGSLEETEKQKGLAHFIEHMAFNGTTNYPKNELVKYLKSTGMRFGADLNAHTGFEETVYKLHVSTIDSKRFEKSIEILREWASEITLDQDDIDAEKEVILEEWRLSQGLTNRLLESQKKIIFGDSRYKERLPIGDPDIVRNATSKELRSYYKKWYTPSNMAVIVVGDIDKGEVEGYIKKYFNYGEKVNLKKPTARLGRGSGQVFMFTDPELTNYSFDIVSKSDRKIITDKKSYREFVVNELFNSIINNRFKWEVADGNPRFRTGYSYTFNIGTKDKVDVVGGILRSKDPRAGVEGIIDTLKSICSYGVSNKELDVEKMNLIKHIHDLLVNKDSIENPKYIEELKSFYLEGESFVELNNQYEVLKEILATISVEDIKKYAIDLYENNNVSYFLTAPSTDKNVPTVTEIRSYIESVKRSKATKNLIDLDNIKLILDKHKDGGIKSKTIEKYSTDYLLSNGMKVIIKDTDYDKDRISIRIFSDGGSSVLDDKLYVASKFIGAITSSGIGNLNIITQDIYLKDKNIFIQPYIDEYEHGLEIQTNRKDLKETFKLIYLLIHDYKLNPTILNNMKEGEIEKLSKRGNSPALVYDDAIEKLLSNDNPRRRTLTIPEVQGVTDKEVLEVFEKLFNNFNDSKGIIIGNLKGLPTERYLKEFIATLPSSENVSKSESLGIVYPSGIKKKKIILGTDKKASVTIVYPYKGKYTYDNRVEYLALARVLENLLLDDIREKIGGVYSIGSYSVLAPTTKGENYLSIDFTTDPARLDEVVDAVNETVKRLVEGRYSDQEIKNIVEGYRFNYNTMLKNNSFWLDYLYRIETYGEKFQVPTPEEYSKLITKSNLDKFVKKSVDLDNYAQIELVPKNIN